MNEVIHELWDRGSAIDKVVDPYTFMAKTQHLSNYRFFTVASLNFANLSSVPDHVKKFIAERPRVLGIANMIKGTHVVSIVFRDLKEKDFSTYSVVSGVPYGLGQYDNFTYGDPLVVVEGLKDRDALHQFIPNVIALCGSSMGKVMREILLTVTNNFVLLYDNDVTGKKQISHDKRVLESAGCRVQIAHHPEGYKDVGEIVDYSYRADFGTSEYLASYHKSQLKVLGIQC